MRIGGTVEARPPRACKPAKIDFHRGPAVLLNPLCPFTAAKVLALKGTVLLLLTLLIKAKIRITAFSALGIFLLLLQTLVFLAISGGLVVAAGGAVAYARQQRRPAGA